MATYADTTERVLPRLLPPPGLALPLLGPLTSNSRSPYVVRPRASAPDASPPAPAANGSDTSSVSSSASLRGSRDTNGIPMPRPGVGMSLGVGAGGTMFFGGVPPSKAASLWPFASRKVRAPVVKQQREKKRILIMMSLTGGGHLASANALKAAFSEKYGDDYEIMVMDMWADYTPEPWKSFPTSYTWMVQNNVWWYMYNFMQPKFVHVPYLRLIHAMSHKMIGAHLEEVQADLIVSVHPLMQHVPLRILKSYISSGILPPTNFATVVTDWTTCANPWFHEDVTRCFVPTDYTHNLALQAGLKEEQIIQHGLPIRPCFAKPLPPKSVMKQRLNLDSDTPAVLLIGGGEGMGKMEEIVDGVAEKVGDFCQMVVCCGRNKELYAKMAAKNYASGMKVTPIGFCENIHEYMHACDTIITKAGPGTMAECLIMGLPMILSGCIPGQEEGNIPYVVENKVGEFHPEPERIADTVRRWLGPERAEFEAMSARAKALGRPEAVYNIVMDLAKLADAPDFMYGPNRWHPQAAQYQAAAAAEAAEAASMSAAMPKLALASLSAR